VQVLAVPNWSFGRDNGLLRAMRDLLEVGGVEIHFLKGDVDHNRTVSAFSGPADQVKEQLFQLAALVLPSIDLNRHLGCHPRIGALDVCPFIPMGEPEEGFGDWVRSCGDELAERFDLPVFLYEKSSNGRALPGLRRQGFGGLLAGEIDPDFGPRRAHPRLGATVLGWRSFLIALNVNLKTEDPGPALTLARHVRDRRRDGDPMFRGVRALGFALPSQGLTQLSMNLTMPDHTPIDPILKWAQEHAALIGIESAGPELIGVIRPRDLEHAVELPFDPRQVVEMR
jgi:glutamate formiminotransferase